MPMNKGRTNGRGAGQMPDKIRPSDKQSGKLSFSRSRRNALMGRKIQKLEDTRIDSAIDFEVRGREWDSVVPGLRLRIGNRKHPWEFYTERRDHGARRYIFKALGFYDRGQFGGYVAGQPGPRPSGLVE